MFDGIANYVSICWKFSKKYIIYTALIQVIGIFKSIIVLIFPQFILDSIFTITDYKRALYCIIVLIGGTFLLTLLSSWLVKKQFVEKMIAFKGFQSHLGKIMMNAPLSTLESNEFMNIKSRAEQYLYGGGNGFGAIIENSFTILGKCLTITFYIIIISKLNIILLISIFLIVIFNITYNFKYQKKMIKISMEQAEQERKSKYFSDILQDFSYGKEIRVFNLSDWLTKKYNNQLNSMMKFYKDRSTNTFFYSLFSTILSTVQQVVSYGYVTLNAIQKKITVGQFSMYLTAISTLSSSLVDVVGNIITLQQYSDYYDAYKEYISIPSVFLQGDISIPHDTEENLEIYFENVSFKYPDSNKYALRNVTTTIYKNDRISIVGKNGAGKSTFIKLLLRIYQPTDGTIYLNGINIQNIKYDEYLKIFSTVFQDFKLFAFSIKENILINNMDDLDSEKFNLYLKEFSLDKKISSLSDGIDTQLYRIFDQNGFTPSGGESQKISIMRSMMKNSQIIILDEPSSALDPEAEFNLFEQFEQLTACKTSIFISHRLGSAKNSKKILVFDDGMLVEEGSHYELEQKNGLYARLFELQSSHYINN